jgi:hypothetical protein
MDEEDDSSTAANMILPMVIIATVDVDEYLVRRSSRGSTSNKHRAKRGCLWGCGEATSQKPLPIHTHTTISDTYIWETMLAPISAAGTHGHCCTR